MQQLKVHAKSSMGKKVVYAFAYKYCVQPWTCLCLWMKFRSEPCVFLLRPVDEFVCWNLIKMECNPFHIFMWIFSSQNRFCWWRLQTHGIIVIYYEFSLSDIVISKESSYFYFQLTFYTIDIVVNLYYRVQPNASNI